MIIGRSIGRNQRRLRKLMEAKDFAKLALLQDAANTDSIGQAILHYEGGTGTNTGFSTSVNFPEFTINHVIPFAVNSSTGVTVTKGNVYSYNGRYYVCIADDNAPAGWQSYDYEKITPDGNKWPYRELVSSATVLTNTDFKYKDNTAPYFQNDSGIPAGTIYKTSDGKVYILKDAAGNGWCALPSSNGNWVLINK